MAAAKPGPRRQQCGYRISKRWGTAQPWGWAAVVVGAPGLFCSRHPKERASRKWMQEGGTCPFAPLYQPGILCNQFLQHLAGFGQAWPWGQRWWQQGRSPFPIPVPSGLGFSSREQLHRVPGSARDSDGSSSLLCAQPPQVCFASLRE